MLTTPHGFKHGSLASTGASDFSIKCFEGGFNRLTCIERNDLEIVCLFL